MDSSSLTAGSGNEVAMSSPAHRALALAATVLALGVPVAHAESPVKPYVMLLVDTSSSMVWPVCYDSYDAILGDNTLECPGKDVPCTGPNACNTIGCGNALKDDTRLFKVKKGAHSVVSAFGEVTFALSRFRNIPAQFTCNPLVDSRIGGWMGENVLATLGTLGNQADVLVGFGDNNQNQIQLWMNNCQDWPKVGDCGPAAGAPPMNGCNLCPDCGGGCDLELRGASSTPIAGALYDLRVNYFNGQVLPADPKKSCRPYSIILLTDGLNNGLGSPGDEAKALFQNAAKSIPVHVVGFGNQSLKSGLDIIANAGGTSQAIIVDNEVSLALAMASIVSESILREKCNGADDDCDLACDETWPEVGVTGASCTNKRAAQACTVGVGMCQKTGVYVCKTDGSGSQCSVTPGLPAPAEVCGNNVDDNCNGAIDEGCQPCTPQPEICDGKDNDCDLAIDEGYVSVACGSAIGECKTGMTACVAGKVVCNGGKAPSPELCDGKDNNCDTVIDGFAEPCYPAASGCDLKTGVCKGVCKIGARLCTASAWGTCFGAQGPLPEVCNGLDDDCDGLVDNGVSSTCMDYTTCKPYATCAACLPAPQEVCDGKDNDCNGKTDETFPEQGQVCGSSVGECKLGVSACVGGKLECSGSIPPDKELCDGKDNDCNGAMDDKVPGDGEPCGESKGECKPGTTRCLGAKYVCDGGTLPQPEVCDGKDNDCDGTVDENAECPGGSACVEGSCVVSCAGSEFNCPGGTKCVNGHCMPDSCGGVKCSPTQRCVDKLCVEKCAGVSCDLYEKCEPTTGQCVDASCYTTGCPAGQVCVSYACVKDPCPPKTCPDGKGCADGQCFEPCAGMTCPSGQYCSQGQCLPRDPCMDHACESNYACVLVAGKPKCEPDPCRIVSCGRGVCRDGKCVVHPCDTARCPDGMRCTLNPAGVADCEVDPDAPLPTTRRILATGGGGCACSAGGALDLSLLPLLLVVGLLALARRRRHD
jgi:MYXO-CTERM domain-containing protein